MAEIISETVVLERPQIASNDSSRCEDCPDINSSPPPSSECQYFDTARNGEPFCSKEDGAMRELAKWSRSSGLGNTACGQLDLVKILETNARLPGAYSNK